MAPPSGELVLRATSGRCLIWSGAGQSHGDCLCIHEALSPEFQLVGRDPELPSLGLLVGGLGIPSCLWGLACEGEGLVCLFVNLAPLDLLENDLDLQLVALSNININKQFVIPAWLN